MTNFKVAKLIFKSVGVGMRLLVVVAALLFACAQTGVAAAIDESSTVAPIMELVPTIDVGPITEIMPITRVVTVTEVMPITETIADEGTEPEAITETLETSGTTEFNLGTGVHTGFVLGNSFAVKPIQYSVIGDLAIFEGDIVLNTVEGMERLVADITGQSGIQLAVVIDKTRFRWPGGIVYYQIDPNLPNPNRVHDAIQHWKDHTHLKFVERTDEPNFITFTVGEICASNVGMQALPQLITLTPNCGRGNIIHEIGHAVGLWHEQSREDRDLFIRINWRNIDPDPRILANFSKQTDNGDDVGPYDYGSIMHYPALAFAIGNLPTIEALNGAAIGQRVALSAGDILGVQAMYPPPVVNGYTSPPSAVARSKETLDVFGLGADQRIYRLTWDGSAWSLEAIDGSFTSPPSAVARGEESIDLFALGADQGLVHLAWNGSQWTTDVLGIAFSSLPSVVARGEESIDLFALGADQRMVHLAWDGSEWTTEVIGGSFTSPPSAVARGEEQLDVFALDANKGMVRLAWDGSRWTTEVIGGSFTSPPSAVARGEEQLDVFALDANKGMVRLAWDGSRWTTEALGGSFTSPPAAVARGEVKLDVFALGVDQSMQRFAWDGSQWKLEGLGGVFTSLPSVVARGEDRLDVFALGADQGMNRLIWDGSQWTTETRGGGILAR